MEEHSVQLTSQEIENLVTIIDNLLFNAVDEISYNPYLKSLNETKEKLNIERLSR